MLESMGLLTVGHDLVNEQREEWGSHPVLFSQFYCFR